MFRKREEPAQEPTPAPIQSRVTSILGEGTSWKGEITGKGGIRIEGLFEGKIDLDGLIIVSRTGRVESEKIKADTVIIGGSVRSDIEANRVEIRSTGKVWGDVKAARFTTEEGAYLRGKIQMEEESPRDIPAAEGQDLEIQKTGPAKPALKPKKSAQKKA
jgi:cytoskeletal protein CcmA (bactofilin family)